MFAFTASTRNASRISPTVMSALTHTQAVASNNSLPIGLGFSIAGPSNVSMSTITVDTTTTNSSDATAANRLSSRRSSLHRRDSGNKVCSSPAAPVLQYAATLPSMPFSPPAAQTPRMLQSSVMPWVFTPPVTTPATPGHDDAHDEGYFPPAQSFQAASAWMSGANQSINTRDTNPNSVTRRSSTATQFYSSGGPLVSTNFAAAASSYIEARTNTFTTNSFGAALEHVGLGITNMRISENNTAEDTEMRMQLNFDDNDNFINEDAMEEENGWDADVEEMDDEEDISGLRTLKSCKERIPTPYNKPSKSGTSSIDFTIGQAL